MREITNDYDERYNRVMDEKEFNEAVLHNCKTSLQRDICKQLQVFRPGWVMNIDIAADVERYVVMNQIWGIETPTDALFAAHLMKTYNIPQLDAAAILGLSQDIRAHNDISEWYRRIQ